MNPQQALERAVHHWLTEELETPLTLIPATSVYRGIDNPTAIDDEDTNTQPSTRVHPSITLAAEGNHEEAVFNTKVYRGNLLVTVEADPKNTTDSTFNAICEEAFSKFDIVQLATNISAANDGFRVLFARITQNGHSVIEGQNWRNFIRVDFVYAQADL